MKVKICFLLSLVMLISGIFFGCQKGSNSESQAPDSSSFEVEESKTAKVIVISGQSNASGFTYVSSLRSTVPDGAFKKYSDGFENVKIYYNVDTIEPNGYTWPTIGCNTSEGEFENVKLGQGHTKERFGPEIGIAEYLSQEHPNETYYIIKCSWGSASLFNDFASPSMQNYATSVYYDKFISVVQAGLDKLKEITDKPIELRAFCWAQGEKDSAAKSNAMNYGPNLVQFVGDFRKAFEEYNGGKEIAFIDAELGLNEKWTCGDIVNQHKAWFAMQGENNYTIATSDLTYHNEPAEKPDVYHFDSLSMIELGRRFGAILSVIL